VPAGARGQDVGLRVIQLFLGGDQRVYSAAHAVLQEWRLCPDPANRAALLAVLAQLGRKGWTEPLRRASLRHACNQALAAIDTMLPVEEKVAFAVTKGRERATVSVSDRAEPGGHFRKNATVYKVSVYTRDPERYLAGVFDIRDARFVSVPEWVGDGERAVAGEPCPPGAEPDSQCFLDFEDAEKAASRSGGGLKRGRDVSVD
jgi:hypothetical protein